MQIKLVVVVVVVDIRLVTTFVSMKGSFDISELSKTFHPAQPAIVWQKSLRKQKFNHVLSEISSWKKLSTPLVVETPT